MPANNFDIFEIFPLSTRYFGNLWDNLYTTPIILGNKSPFTCGKSKLYQNTVNYRTILTGAVDKILLQLVIKTLQELYLHVQDNCSKKLFIKMIFSSKSSLTVIYVFKVNNKSTRIRWEIRSKSTIKEAEQRQLKSRTIIISPTRLTHINPLSANPTKWSNTLKHFVDDLFECVWPFCEIGV